MFLFAGSEIITVKAENINDSKTNRLIAYEILSQKPQVSNGFSFNTGRDMWMISREIGEITLQEGTVGARLGPLPAQQLPAVPGGTNSLSRSLLWAPVAPCRHRALLQWHGHLCRSLLSTSGTLWRDQPCTQIPLHRYPHTQTILQGQTILQLTLHWPTRSLKLCYPDFLEIRSRTDLESEEQILSCPIYNITDPVVDRTVKEPLLLQKIFPLGQQVHLYFFASS